MYIKIDFNLFSEIARIGEAKKVHMLTQIAEEQLLVALCGRQRHVRLVPIRALYNTDVDWIKVRKGQIINNAHFFLYFIYYYSSGGGDQKLYNIYNWDDISKPYCILFSCCCKTTK